MIDGADASSSDRDYSTGSILFVVLLFALHFIPSSRASPARESLAVARLVYKLYKPSF